MTKVRGPADRGGGSTPAGATPEGTAQGGGATKRAARPADALAAALGLRAEPELAALLWRDKYMPVWTALIEAKARDRVRTARASSPPGR